jgi:iron complex transport system substrate-binding protein
MAINAKNVADETGNKSSFEVDLEKVAAWDPDIIFLDPGNMNLVNDEYAAKPEFFNSLTAVKNGQIYTMPAFNNYSTNITYCLMDAYFAGTVLYPEQFKDVDMKTKSGEIMKKFLGKDWYDEMQADGLYYGTITLGQ